MDTYDMLDGAAAERRGLYEGHFTGLDTSIMSLRAVASMSAG
ncbi:hypothetical protein [Mycobacterium lepromatosis]|nr:hypothetical protein [Mycobacterium lepromatosis]